jgi:hypothetical protein
MLSRVGAWTAIAGAILAAVTDEESTEISLAIALAGLALLLGVAIVDQRLYDWVAAIRAGRVPRLSVLPATDAELELPPLWSLDPLADEVIAESWGVAAGPYRSSHTRRAIARISSESFHHALARRRILALLTLATLSAILLLNQLHATVCDEDSAYVVASARRALRSNARSARFPSPEPWRRDTGPFCGCVPCYPPSVFGPAPSLVPPSTGGKHW